MGITQDGVAEGLLQPVLPGRGIQQVGTPHDMSNVLGGVSNDDRQLVREEAIGTSDDEVVSFSGADSPGDGPAGFTNSIPARAAI